MIACNEDGEPKQGTKTGNQNREPMQGIEKRRPGQGAKTGNQAREPKQETKTERENRDENRELRQ